MGVRISPAYLRVKNGAGFLELFSNNSAWVWRPHGESGPAPGGCGWLS